MPTSEGKVMATEKDKTIQKLLESTEWRSTRGIILDAWAAGEASGRADAIEECAKIADAERERCKNEWFGDLQVSSCEHIAAAIRRSLSRKQEGA